MTRTGARMIRRSMIAALALVASSAATTAQDASFEAVPYCSDLQQVANLAMTRERFASIIGKPREGNFLDTSLVLRGWKDCGFYGSATYTCESRALKTAAEAEQAQARTVKQILACLGNGWFEVKDQSSAGFVVLHPALGPASITLNLAETDDKAYAVRLVLFIRRY